jgi:hypothetical protein
MKDTSWFNGSTDQDEGNLLKKTGKGILTVGTLIGAGVLLGMGIEAVSDNV